MWPNPQFVADLVAFTEEIRNAKCPFCAVTLRFETIFGNWKPFKNDEKSFLFQLKIFVLKRFKFLSWLFGSKRLD